MSQNTHLSSQTLITPSSPGITTAAFTSSVQPSNLFNKAGFFVVQKRSFGVLGAGLISAAIFHELEQINSINRQILSVRKEKRHNIFLTICQFYFDTDIWEHFRGLFFSQSSFSVCQTTFFFNLVVLAGRHYRNWITRSGAGQWLGTKTYKCLAPNAQSSRGTFLVILDDVTDSNKIFKVFLLFFFWRTRPNNGML